MLDTQEPMEGLSLCRKKAFEAFHDEEELEKGGGEELEEGEGEEGGEGEDGEGGEGPGGGEGEEEEEEEENSLRILNYFPNAELESILNKIL